MTISNQPWGYQSKIAFYPAWAIMGNSAGFSSEAASEMRKAVALARTFLNEDKELLDGGYGKR